MAIKKLVRFDWAMKYILRNKAETWLSSSGTVAHFAPDYSLI